MEDPVSRKEGKLDPSFYYHNKSLQILTGIAMAPPLYHAHQKLPDLRV